MKTPPVSLLIRRMIPAIFAMLLSGAGTALAFNGGDGSRGAPYQVATAEHLDAVRNHLGAHFIQTADIDLGVAPWNEGAGWVPIGEDDGSKFIGNYDGCGHRIMGLWIDRPAENQVGLFGVVSGGGTLVRIHLESVNATGAEEVGALCGWNDGGRILLSRVSSGAVSGGFAVGGLVGKNGDGASIVLSSAHLSVTGEVAVGGLAGDNTEGSRVERSYATGTISGMLAVGGLVGTNIDGVIRDAYALGAVGALRPGEDAVFLGGLVGLNGIEVWEGGVLDETGSGLVERSYATGALGAGLFTGGLIGSQGHVIQLIDDEIAVGDTLDLGAVADSFWNNDVVTLGVGSGSGDGATGLSDAEMRGLASFVDAGWDVMETWRISDGSDYPTLRTWIQLLDNRSFDLADGAGWEVADDPGVLRAMVFDNPGEANLHGSFRGPLIWQELSIHCSAGLVLRAKIQLAAGFYPDDISTEAYLEYVTRSGALKRVLLFDPENSTVDYYPEGSVFATIIQVPWDAYELTGFVVDRAGPGEFWLLETSLEVIGAVTPISTLGDLQKIGYDPAYPLDGWYALTNDIDASATAGWNAGAGFLPIGGVAEAAEMFTGVFDGNGYQINGLVIHQPALQKVGLFREIKQDAVIRDVGLVGGEVGGAENSGALVGFNAGIVERCYAKAVHVVGEYFGGGLVGESEGLVRDSFARGSVNAYVAAGGLVGFGMDSAIENSFAASVLQRWGQQWAQFGSLVGGPGAIITSSYGDGDVASSADGVWVEGFTTAEMTHPYGEGIYTDWDFDATWIADVDGTLNDGYPFLRSAMTPFVGGLGTADFPFLVATAEQLDRVRDYEWAHFRQIADIDLGEAPWNEGDGWVPMFSFDWETGTGGFGGVYDGAGYAIRNIFHADDADYSGGLFSVILLNGVLRNIHMDGGRIGMRFWDAAALASENNGLIENCSVSTEVVYSYEMGGGLVVMNFGVIRNSIFSGSVDGGHWVGGLAAMNAGVIENSHCSGEVGANFHSVGGIAGLNSGIVRDSSTTGTIASTIDPMWGGDLEFHYAAGGLVGENYGVIERSHSSAFVDGRGDPQYMSEGTGGLVGINGGVIFDSYAMGPVIGQTMVGGLVGQNAEGWSGDPEDLGTIERTYSTGAVTGVDEVGGLVGSNTGDVNASYWNTITSGVGTSAGGQGRGTDAMTYPHGLDTYVGWDFVNEWAADTGGTVNGGYPYLRAPGDDPPPGDGFTLTYYAGPGGSLVGPSPQFVAAGENGGTIFANPDTGAEFHEWSDGSTANPRVDENVQADIEVTAYFRSLGGVVIDWYAGHSIGPVADQTWADLDLIVPPGKTLTLQQHFVAMLDPHDPAARFGVGHPQWVGDAFEVPFHPSSPDRRYTLWRSSNLAEWTIVPGQERVSGGNGPMVDADPPDPSAFYRIEVSMP